MEILIVLFYILLLSWLIRRMNFFRLEDLPGWVVYVLFGTKVLGGMAYYFIHNIIYPIDQTNYFRASETIYSSLFENPLYYLRLVLGPNDVFLNTPMFKYAYEANFWSHAGNYAIVRFHAICRLFSFGHYTVHVVFMAFLMLIAGILFYRVLRKLSLFHSYLLAILVFGIPSLVFWTAGIHKDGFVYLGLGICLFHLYQFVEERARWYNLFWLAFGILTISTIRFYLNMLLFPALFMLFFTLLKPQNALFKFANAYLIGGVLLILLNFILPINIYEMFAAKQNAFLVEVGGSDFYVRKLDPNFWSVFSFIPSAFFNALLRPFPWDIDSVMQMISSVEVGVLGLLLILVLIYRKPEINWHPVLVFLLFYALSNLLLIGFLVSNSGTLVRYRSIAFSFIFLVIVNMLDLQRVPFFPRSLLKREV